MQDTLLTSGHDSVDRSTYTTASITPSQNRLVLLVCHASGTSDPPTPTVTGNGLTWVLIGSVGLANGRLAVFRAMKTDGAPSSGSVSIAYGSTFNRCRWIVVEISGTDRSGTNGSGAIRGGSSIKTATVSSGFSISLTLDSPLDSDNRPFFATDNSTLETINHRTNWTEIAEVVPGAESIALEAQWREDAFETTASASWASDTNHARAIGFEIIAGAPVSLAASLQGVGSLTGKLNYQAALKAVLQGVGSLVPRLNYQAALKAVLQGVGKLTGLMTGTPSLDFTKYDAYIDGPDTGGTQGLLYYEGEGSNPQTVSQRLQPARTDTGQTPFEIRPESGDIFGQNDFSEGMGQTHYHRDESSRKKYLFSEGFDLDEPGLLKHLHDTGEAHDSVNIGDLAMFNDLPFVVDGTSIRRGDGAFPGTWTDDPPHLAEGAVTVNRIVSSGEFLYAALGVNGIHRRNTAGTWTHWNDLAATRIAWLKNRIIAGNGVSIFEVTAGGAAPSALETLPAGWVFESFFEVQGFIYACAVNKSSGLSRIHVYGLNDAGSALEKKTETPMPRNQLIYVGLGYLGVAFLAGGVVNDSNGYDPVFYQAFPETDGSLTYTKQAEGEGSGAADLSVRSLEPIGENVITGWSLAGGFPYHTASRDGLGIFYLKTGGFATYFKKTGAGASKRINGILFYKGRVLFSIDGDGLYYEDTSKFVITASLTTSIADWSTAADKLWDLLEVSHEALLSGQSVELRYTTSHPENQSWNSALVSNTVGSSGADKRISNLQARIFAVQIVSTAPAGGATAPEVIGYAIRSNLIPDNPEFVLTRTVRLLASDQKDQYAPTVLQDPTILRRNLQRSAYKWVTLYEPGVTWTVRVARVADLTPVLPQLRVTMGEPLREGYVLQLTMEGTRD